MKYSWVQPKEDTPNKRYFYVLKKMALIVFFLNEWFVIIYPQSLYYHWVWPTSGDVSTVAIFFTMNMMSDTPNNDDKW